ncbi:MAG: hypothetical protein KBE96_06455, partial [Bacteroidales bacterium]|nr:hypothetical protein [Bacteroidales bacterium]
KHYPVPYNWRRIFLFVFSGVALYLISIPFSEVQPLLRYSIHTILITIFILIYLKVEKINIWRLKL